MLYQETLYGSSETTQQSKPKFPAVALEFKINRLGVLIHAMWWFIGLVLVSYMFFYPYFAGLTPSLESNPFALIQDYGNLAYYGLGVLLVAMFSFYLAVLIRPIFSRGPLYKVDIRGVQFNLADGVMLPASAIRSAFLTYSHGMANGVVLEVTDRERLKQIKNKLPSFAPVTFDFREGSMTISLAGLKKKMVFVGAIQYLCARQRR